MTNGAAIQAVNLGDYAALAPTGYLPEISEEDTKAFPADYIKIIGHTVNDTLYGGTDIFRDDYVYNDQGTGAGGKMLTDARDMSQSDLMKHAYSMGQAIVVDLSAIANVLDFSFAAIDLDHNEYWKFVAFDSGNNVVDIITTGPGVSGGDGVAYPFAFSTPGVAKVAFWGWNNNANSGIVGYAFDQLCVTAE